jgi:hypothetical protein
MSLCDSGGEDGEGDGAIAEVAVFNKVLKEDDIATIENMLMEKHGIARNTSEDQVAENYSRQAHSLLSQPTPWKRSYKDGIPLRYAAQHISVSWEKVNKVTGRPIQINRIGSKTNDSGSDW